MACLASRDDSEKPRPCTCSMITSSSFRLSKLLQLSKTFSVPRRNKRFANRGVKLVSFNSIVGVRCFSSFCWGASELIIPNRAALLSVQVSLDKSCVTVCPDLTQLQILFIFLYSLFFFLFLFGWMLGFLFYH